MSAAMASSDRLRFLFFCVACVASVWGESKEDYLQRREDLVQQERMVGTGGGVSFTPKEETVNKKLMELKKKEIESYRSQDGGQNFPPANNFITAKSNIESSDVFKILKAMPKGAALHVHDMAITDLRWIIANMTYHPNNYMCILPRGLIKMGFYLSAPEDPECEWFNTNEAREEFEDIEAFDEMLYHGMSMDNVKSTTFPNQNAVWEKFLSCFTALEGMFFSEIGFEAIFTRGLQDFYDDNVQYMEIRGLFMDVARLDGGTYNTTWLVGAYAEAVRKFTETHPDFVGAKNIPTVIRAMDKSDVDHGIKDAIAWKRLYPDQIAGFDLVGQEDPGHPLLYFLDELLEPTENGDADLPYIFHAGETNWIGQDVDNNLVDAVLLNTSRIGHGYALARHPVALKYVMENNIAVELNPVSNQVLMLVSDLRNHPGAALMAMGVPVVISSDDPTLWGAAGLSHDFYEAFMGLAGGWGDMGTLKTLALDSIRFSAMSADEKQKTMDIWQRKWDEFLDKIIADYKLEV